MSSAVHDLQRAITSGSKPLTQLLRETKLIAAKLNLADVEQWVDYELGGYPVGIETPKYRKCRTSFLESLNPVRGWHRAGPLQIDLVCRQPITTLEQFAGADWLSMDLPKKLALTDQMGRPLDWEQRAVIGGTSFKQIVEAVTNELLQWAIELEKRGIKGENMSFDEREKQSATHQVFNIQKFTGVLGDVTNSHVTLYDYSSIHQLLKEHNVPREERNELEDIMDSLKTAPPEQKPSIVEKGKQWIVRNKELLGAAGVIVAKAIGAAM